MCVRSFSGLYHIINIRVLLLCLLVEALTGDHWPLCLPYLLCVVHHDFYADRTCPERVQVIHLQLLATDL